MTGTDGTDRADEALRDRLRAADPATSLPPATPEGLARLLEETMSHDQHTETEPAESRADGTRGRGPLTWLVAAAAAVVIAGTAVAVTVVGGEGPGEDPPSAAPSPTVTELTAPSGETPRCLPPSADVLAGKPIAFDGTVDSVDEGVVTLTPTQWYAGDATDVVTVEAPPDRFELLLTSVAFREGGRYLVAANQDGSVMICGFSAEWSPAMEKLYAEAFPR